MGTIWAAFQINNTGNGTMMFALLGDVTTTLLTVPASMEMDGTGEINYGQSCKQPEPVPTIMAQDFITKGISRKQDHQTRTQTV
jgi:hypothetical protein